jgi:hypothetical protein
MENVDVTVLRPGDKVRTVEGSVAEVLKESQDGQWILVRYLSSTQNPTLVGTEDLCHGVELQAVGA